MTKKPSVKNRRFSSFIQVFTLRNQIHIKMLSIHSYIFKESVLKTCYNGLGLSKKSQQLSFVRHHNPPCCSHVDRRIRE